MCTCVPDVAPRVYVHMNMRRDMYIRVAPSRAQAPAHPCVYPQMRITLRSMTLALTERAVALALWCCERGDGTLRGGWVVALVASVASVAVVASG